MESTLAYRGLLSRHLTSVIHDNLRIGYGEAVKLLVLLLLALSGLVLASPPEPVLPASVGLSQAQAKQLAGLGFPAVVPGYVPENFRLKSLTVRSNDRFSGASYQMHYEGPGGAVFNLFGQRTMRRSKDQGTAPTRRLPFTSPLFGRGFVNWHQSVEGGPSFVGTGPLTPTGPAYLVSGTDLDPTLTVRIVEGLRFLKG